MRKFIIVFIYLFPSLLLLARASETMIQKYDWDGIEVVYLKDARYPTYNALIYFADGSLSDRKNELGATNAMFSLLGAGTRRFSQKELSDNLEYYGVSYGGSSTHEASSYAISGLVKNIIPTMKKICHMFADAQFPPQEIRKAKIRAKDSLNSMVTSHSTLARRVFRELSLAKTPFSYPVGGKLRDIRNLKSKVLKKKLEYFNKRVYKKIYLSGPPGVLAIKDIINKECGWRKKQSSFKRSVSYKPKKFHGTKIHLVTVPNANQAHVRVGRVLNKDELHKHELMQLTSSYLGGGFTSKLMREIRVKRGLSYTANAFASEQKDYGRAGVASFTKNSTLGALITVIRDTLASVQKGKFPKEELERARGHLTGGYPFKFEMNAAYLGELIHLDHTGRDYADILKFIDRVKSYSTGDVMAMTKALYSWDKQTIVVVGDKSLLKQLKQFGKVKMHNYKNFL